MSREKRLFMELRRLEKHLVKVRALIVEYKNNPNDKLKTVIAEQNEETKELTNTRAFKKLFGGI